MVGNNDKLHKNIFYFETATTFFNKFYCFTQLVMHVAFSNVVLITR